MSKKNVLLIKSSINGDVSKSNQLSKAIVEKIKNTYQECLIDTIDLSENPLPFLTAEMYRAFSTPKSERSPAQLAAILPSENAI